MCAASDRDVARNHGDRFGQDVFGKVEVDRSRHARLRDLKCGPHQPRDVFRLDELIVPLGDFAHHPHDVKLVPQIAIEPEGIKVGRHHQQRHRVLLRRPDAEHGVRDAGPDVE